jgi:hypothetical protein
MNTDTVHFQLNEALEHLRAVVAELDDGRMQSDDAPGLAVDLSHILHHVCSAWNSKDMSLLQRAALSQEEFERLGNTVPNFNGEKVLGEFACV